MVGQKGHPQNHTSKIGVLVVFWALGFANQTVSKLYQVYYVNFIDFNGCGSD